MKLSSKDITCLAENIYFEARGESFQGKLAVAQVTLNRANHPTKFKSTVCGVVHEKNQFSWTRDPHQIRDRESWLEAKAIAYAVAKGQIAVYKFDALYYHTKQVFPKWRKSFAVSKVIGEHIFYIESKG